MVVVGGLLVSMYGILCSDYVSISGMNSYCRVYGIGDMIAVLGSVDFVLGSVDG